MQDYDPGWWRHPSHRRSVAKADSFNFQATIKKALRRRRIGYVARQALYGVAITLVALLVLRMCRP